MEALRLSGGDWSHEPILRARGFIERLRGLRGHDAGTSMLLETSSVHSFGMNEPFWAVGLTALGVVSEVRMVRPGRIVVLRDCRYVMELPLGVPPPSVGARLDVSRV